MKSHILDVLVLAAAGCATTVMSPAAASRRTPETYVAHLRPLNGNVSGMQSTGEARFTIRGDSLTITVDAQHVAPGVMHLQHFHGFTDGRNATCPSAAADTSHDGIVDLLETEPVSGTTMVPFTADPVSMQIATDSYPVASADGSYHYQQTVSLSALQGAFGREFEGRSLDLTRRVVFIHGVAPDTKLPASVASLGTIPAQATLPIACGPIELSLP